MLHALNCLEIFTLCHVTVGQVMGAYGYNIEHILMVDIIPDSHVRMAMNEINAGSYFHLSYWCFYLHIVSPLFTIG